MKKHLFLLAIVSIASLNCFAQKKATISTADKIKVPFVYINVIKVYERVAEKGYKSIDMFKKIGDSYYSNFELNKAARWYCELFNMTYDLEPKYYYQYANSLKSIGENDAAVEILEKLNQQSEKLQAKNSQKDILK
jgi:tetratricopeptide (TPR) repeat protein